MRRYIVLVQNKDHLHRVLARLHWAAGFQNLNMETDTDALSIQCDLNHYLVWTLQNIGCTVYEM